MYNKLMGISQVDQKGQEQKSVWSLYCRVKTALPRSALLSWSSPCLQNCWKMHFSGAGNIRICISNRAVEHRHSVWCPLHCWLLIFPHPVISGTVWLGKHSFFFFFFWLDYVYQPITGVWIVRLANLVKHTCLIFPQEFGGPERHAQCKRTTENVIKKHVKL